MALIEKWGKAAILGAGVLALATRCVSVVDDPTGHDNLIDGVLMAGFINVAGVTHYPSVVHGQGAVTKAVFDAMHVRSPETNFWVYAKNLIGNKYEVANGKPGDEQLYDIAKILKDNPHGTRANKYTDDELKGFYLFLFNKVHRGTKFQDMRVPPEYDVAQLAELAYDAAKENCIRSASFLNKNAPEQCIK